MTNELPPIILKGKELIKYRHLKRKYPVSQAFLHRNWWNAKRFITYALRARCVLRTYAWRQRRSHRVRLVRRVRILLFDPRLKEMIKRRLQNVRQWSSGLVGHYKKMGRIEEHEEMELYSVPEPLAAEEVTKQMKEQLELLKSGKRGLSLMEDANRNMEVLSEKPAESDSEGALEKESETTEPMESASCTTAALAEKTDETETVEEESKAPEPMETDIAQSKAAAERTPKKSSAQTTALDEAPTPPTPSKEQSNQTSTCSSAEKQEKSEKAGGSKFLDMLISKVRVKTFAREDNIPSETSGTALPVVFEDDGSEDFVGFDESVHQPGMLLTPLVPQNCKTLDRNSAFVSDTLDAYMREHYSNDSGQEEKDKLLEPMGHDGQVTSHSMPPPMDMPAVPEALQRLRTVAERRQYLQRCKNQKMAIINNEANIYRELQRKQRQRKVKIGAMQALQAPDSQMPFTRQGWQAASYVATENSKYYYQVIQVDGAMVRLPGARGNNLQREKKPYLSSLTRRELASLRCSDQCLDARIQEELTVIPTKAALPRNPKILNQFPIPAIFRPCPLSKKPLQRPLDDDTAALLLAGGSMAVVSMPNVQLDVMPEVGRPLDEIAKRYLQHILPHHDITREWAEFSVSTLQQPPVCMKDAEEQASQTPAGRRKSFTFVIPYLNDRNHILVRRVVDRSEELDASFNEIPEKLQEFTFRSKLPLEPDSDLLACADMINDMINTVAISCSENSFISEDPDAAIESSNRERSSSELGFTKDEGDKEAEKLAGGKTKRLPNKQKRLANELRRLNATIIDAAARNADAKKPCIKDHCQLGCLCASLAGTDLPLRDHCGRPECVLECRCLGADQARVMRVEAADGHGISNDEAFNLRRKATARLAKMEKDFTSTLVLCDNETLLINDSQGDKKRRCTKAPKRYEDFDDTDMFEEQEVEVVSPTSKKQKKLAAAAAAAAATAAAAAAAAAANAKITSPILKERCTVNDTDLAQLKHCSVSLRRLTDIDNLATFCMTHQLYKCFCGGDSIEGKPVVIEKEQWNTTVAHFNPDLAVRAHYSFERQTEELPAKKKGGKEKKIKGKTELKPKNESDSDIPKSEKKEPKTDTKEDIKSREKPNFFGDECPIQRSIELDTIFSYFRSRPHICRRAISVPKNSYQRLNQRRAERVRHYIERQETPETRELLMSRISGAITHYRKEIDRQRKRELGRKQLGLNVPPVIEVRDDSDGSEVSSLLLKRSAEKSTKGQKPSKRMKLQEEESSAPAPEPQSPRKSDIQVPRIAACYSLNAASVDVLGSGMTNNASAVAMSVNSTNDTDSPKFRSFYNEVVKNMNTLVSKKMQDIDLALQRESKIIPVPNEEILCIIKWTNFLAAFESGFVYIWIVQMKTHTFLAATITNQMPSVCGAIGVVNTKFAPDQRALPLMASLLIEGKRNENTNRLAVVMQGRKSYWLVKGFLRLMEGNACTKPTPQTHPLLTRKINVLCSLLVKQRVREHQRKMHQGGGDASSSTCTSPVPETQGAPTKRKLKTAPGADASETEPQRAEATSSSTAVASTPPVAAPSVSRKTSSLGHSNIEFRKVSHSDVDELQIPELHDYDHRWVVLDIFDDFSHIFVPACGDMISLTRIHTVMRMSAESQKVVRLQFFPNAPYDAFVTPSSKKKIYFGPLHLDMPPPVLLLLQSVDRKMMTREAYQKDHGIPVQRHRRSMAFWVLHLNGQVHFEIEDESTAKLEATQPIKIPSHLSVEISNKVEKQTTKSFPSVVIIDSDEEEEEVDDHQLEAGQLVDTDEQPTVTQIKQEHPRMNFTIQTVPTSGALQITAAEPVAPSPSNPPKDVTTCQLTGGFMPFISKVPVKEGEPSANTTTQYLTPQVQLTKSLLNAATSSSSSAHPPAAKISRPSAPLTKINESLQELLSSGNTVTPGGITITKMDSSRDTKEGCQQNNETIVKIGSKRTVSGIPKQPTPKAMPSVLKAASAGTSILRKLATAPIVKATPSAQHPRQQQPDAQPSAGVKLYPRPSVHGQRQSMPENASPMGRSVGPRQSLPTKPMAASSVGPRQSLPPKPMAASSVGPRQSLPTKPIAASSVSTPKLPVTGAEPSSRQSLPNSRERQSLPVKVAGKPAVRSDQASPPKASPTITQRAKGTDCSYGVIGAKGLPRYRVKVMGSDIIVKIPDLDVVHFKSFMAASGFLNRHLKNIPEFKALLPADWKFLPLKQAPKPQQQQQQVSVVKHPATESHVPSKNQHNPASIIIED